MRLMYSCGGLLSAAVLFLPPAGVTQPVMPETAPPGAEIQLRPHVAVYDMTLYSAAPGANVSEVRGRMVYSFRGSACAGYTIINRVVTQILDRDGKAALTDTRSSTWEAARGGRFRFNSAQYLDNRLSEQASGLAAREPDAGGMLEVTIEKPRKRKMAIAGQPMFPTEHSFAILEAARAGRGGVYTMVYDGSQNGSKVLDTSTAIGKPLPADANRTLPSIKNAEQLDGVVSWPVTISYFEANKPPRFDEGLPAYEMSFRLYANGVSRKLIINYGHFTVKGELSRLEFFEPAACTGQDEPRLAPVSESRKGKRGAR